MVRSGIDIADPARCHDAAFLLERWHRVAKAARLNCLEIARVSGYPILAISPRTTARTLPIYISSGIHGDEAGATEGFISWAEAHVDDLAKSAPVMLPCLNPWGLTQNSRLDEQGRDLNRAFRRGRSPLVLGLKHFLQNRRFDLALTLHEDYDANGLYIYEIDTGRPPWADLLITHLAPVIPGDTRPLIEGREAHGSVIRRKFNPIEIPLVPEALYLHFRHARRVFTFETPSEFALSQRAETHRRLIEASLDLWKTEHAKAL